MNLKHVSFRLPTEYVSTIQKGAKANKVSQTAFLQALIDKHNLNGGLEFAKKSKTPKLANGGTFDIPDADLEILKNLGIASAFGFGGYLLTGEIRKQMQKDEDKGTQMLVGLLVGLLSMWALSNDIKK